MIPVAEFWRTLQKWGTGELGWDPDKTLDADMNAIILGHEGRWDMINGVLKAVFGDKPAPEPPALALPPLTPAALREMGRR